MGLIYDVEIGYAFYVRGTQAWDTSIFQIEPGLNDEAPDFELELLHKAQEQLFEEIAEQCNRIAVAGTWLHSYEEKPSEKAVCPQCHEYDSETQIKDHGVCYDCMQANYRVSGKENEARELWTELGDIPVDDDGNIEEAFRDFPIGTDREEIWHWFEETFSIAIYDLMWPGVHNDGHA